MGNMRFAALDTAFYMPYFQSVGEKIGRKATEQRVEDGSLAQGCGAHLRRRRGVVCEGDGRAAPPRLARNAHRRIALGLAQERLRTPPPSRLAAAKSSPARGAAGHLPSTRGRRLICW